YPDGDGSSNDIDTSIESYDETTMRAMSPQSSYHTHTHSLSQSDCCHCCQFDDFVYFILNCHRRERERVQNDLFAKLDDVVLLTTTFEVVQNYQSLRETDWRQTDTDTDRGHT